MIQITCPQSAIDSSLAYFDSVRCFAERISSRSRFRDLFQTRQFHQEQLGNFVYLPTPSHLYPGLIPKRFGGGGGPVYSGFRGPLDVFF